jgi:hypothetical protein
MDNLFYYNAGREVPKEAQKPFNNGKFQGTDINPMWRIKKLTELFGPAGIGWYVDDVVERSEIHGETTISIVTLNLYVKVNGEWSKPIYGTGGNTLLRKGVASDEGYKMAYTDALSVACKALGIGADIWYANDRTKYTAGNDTAEPKAAPAKPEKPQTKAPEMFICQHCGKVLTPYKDANGKDISIRQHAAGSEKKFGQVLCIDCITKLYPDAVKK